MGQTGSTPTSQSPKDSRIVQLQTDKTYQINTLGEEIGNKKTISTIYPTNGEAYSEFPSSLEKLYESIEYNWQLQNEVGGKPKLDNVNGKHYKELGTISIIFDHKDESEPDRMYISGLTDQEFDLVMAYVKSLLKETKNQGGGGGNKNPKGNKRRRRY